MTGFGLLDCVAQQKRFNAGVVKALGKSELLSGLARADRTTLVGTLEQCWRRRLRKKRVEMYAPVRGGHERVCVRDGYGEERAADPWTDSCEKHSRIDEQGDHTACQ